MQHRHMVTNHTYTYVYLEMRFMCVSHDRSEEMSIPIYLAEDTDSSMIQYAIVKSVLLVYV